MRDMTQRFLVALLAVGLTASPAMPQSQQQSTPAPTAVPAPPPPATDSTRPPNQVPPLRTTSDLVRIDVEVTDRSGAAIKGLRADQFTVTDNGKPQKISSFVYADIEAIEQAGNEDQKPITIPVDPPAPLPEEAVTNAVRDRRLLVLFFDMTSMENDDLLRAHDAAQKFIDKQMT
ncbi:MAG: hypothetical protein WAK91_14710, partial [Candidatus Acidiferrales bacterium]